MIEECYQRKSSMNFTKKRFSSFLFNSMLLLLGLGAFCLLYKIVEINEEIKWETKRSTNLHATYLGANLKSTGPVFNQDHEEDIGESNCTKVVPNYLSNMEFVDKSLNALRLYYKVASIKFEVGMFPFKETDEDVLKDICAQSQGFANYHDIEVQERFRDLSEEQREYIYKEKGRLLIEYAQTAKKYFK